MKLYFLDVAFPGPYEVMIDLDWPHLQNVPAATAIPSLEHLVLNMFHVNTVGTSCLSLPFILLNINA